MVDHDFGGPWTEIKLDAVEYYLECYTKALKRVGFDLTYIDAFAGTGSRDVEREVGAELGDIVVHRVADPEAGVPDEEAGDPVLCFNLLDERPRLPQKAPRGVYHYTLGLPFPD